MRRMAVTILLIAVAVVTAVLGQRLAGNAVLPAAAKEATQGAVVSAVIASVAGSVDLTAHGGDPEAASRSTRPLAEPSVADQPSQEPVEAVTPSTAEASEPAPAPAPSSTARPASAPPAIPPARTPAPVVPVVPAPPAAPVATPAPTSCPATWFCYPRLGIAGAIVPYSDCTGSTDVGTSIRSFTCLSPFYLMGHAYTQFGQITQWRAGDVVFASGRSFVISGAFTQSSCAAPARAIAPLSLQTSLTSGGCGSVLVVQGN